MTNIQNSISDYNLKLGFKFSIKYYVKQKFIKTMSSEKDYIRLLEESVKGIEASQKEVEKLKNKGFYPGKDYEKIKLDISLSTANLSASKLNYYASKNLKESLSKSSKVQRMLTWSIVIIGGLNLIISILKNVDQSLIKCSFI